MLSYFTTTPPTTILTLQTRYIIETYDTQNKFLPKDAQTRAKVREWIHAAEGTFMLHALAILYARWRLPESVRDALPEMDTNLSPNMINDMNWLEGELKAQKGKGSDFIVGKELTAADIMMGFTIEFIMERKLGVKGLGEGRWKEVEAWWGRVRQRQAYKKAVERTGYTLDGDFKK
jgi:glutathione S-transferase